MKKFSFIFASIVLSNSIFCSCIFAKEENRGSSNVAVQSKLSYGLSDNILSVTGEPGIENSFFGIVDRTKHIERWGILINREKESLNDHLLDTARIAHMLALIKNKFYSGKVDVNRVAVLAMYHDLTEIFTDDMPTPVKYGQPGMKALYDKMDEKVADEFLLRLPKEFRNDFKSILKRQEKDAELWKIVKNADKLSAFIKCLKEKNLGNKDFDKAYGEVEKTLLELADQYPEVKYFMETFLPSFGYKGNNPSEKTRKSKNLSSLKSTKEILVI